MSLFKQTREDQYLKEMVPAARSPIPFLQAIAHGCCFIGLCIGYHEVLVGGEDSWNRFSRLRRLFLGGSIVSGFLGGLLHTHDWTRSYFVRDYASRYPLMWIGRTIHIGTGLFLIFTEFIGASWAKYAFYSLFAQIATADFASAWRMFYLGSHLRQALDTVEEQKKQLQANKN